jgi:hypothetical protein
MERRAFRPGCGNFRRIFASENRSDQNANMKHDNHKALARRVDALARSEQNIHERLHSLRGEIDIIAKLFDRALMTRHPRIRAGMNAHGGLTPLRGVIDLVSVRKDRGPR